jgi:hypothetical protein
VIANNILRPLHPDTRVQPGPRSYTAKTLIIMLCALDVDIMEIYTRRWGLNEYSPMMFVGIWNVTCNLISKLDNDARATDLFTRACYLMRILERDLPIVRLTMQGLLSVACQLGQRIPVDAKRYFEGIDSNKNELKDVPVNFVLPVQEEVRALLSDDGEGDTSKLGGDLAALLGQWSAMSIE